MQIEHYLTVPQTEWYGKTLETSLGQRESVCWHHKKPMAYSIHLQVHVCRQLQLSNMNVYVHAMNYIHVLLLRGGNAQ